MLFVLLGQTSVRRRLLDSSSESYARSKVSFKPSPHKQIFCGQFSVTKIFLLAYKDSKCYVENSFAYAPEMTMDSRDKTEEATANPWVSSKSSVTGRAHKQTFVWHFFFTT